MHRYARIEQSIADGAAALGNWTRPPARTTDHVFHHEASEKIVQEGVFLIGRDVVRASNLPGLFFTENNLIVAAASPGPAADRHLIASRAAPFARGLTLGATGG